MVREIKTIKITEKGQIVIPKIMRELRGFREGSKVNLIAYDDKIELRPMEQIEESLLNALATEKVLARDWLSKEDEEAWKDL